MRLITRSDFDGLACAVLLEEAGVVDDYLFVHPKDAQDGKVSAGQQDVVANIPYISGCGMWFDHHSSEEERLGIDEFFEYEGKSQSAPSCARVIYDYYGGDEKFHKFDISGLMPAVDRSDTAAFSTKDIMSPKGWVLLSFIVDSRTGLGRYQDYRISNHDLLRDLIKYCRTMDIDTILEVPDVCERINRYTEQEVAYEKMIRANSSVDQNVIVIDLLNVEELLSGNRFIEYALYPYQNVSARIFWGKNRQNVVISVGHSIIHRDCKTDVGSLMLKYGGGGHKQVGTCQVPATRADEILQEIVSELKEDG